MIRSVATVAVGTVVLAALTGCAYQQSFGLPELTPRGASPGAQVYPGYGYSSGYGYGAGYPGAYQPGYGNIYGYAGPYSAAQGPYPYSYGYAYDAFPRYVVVPCADNNRDGRCDTRPPRNHHDRDQQGQDDADRPAQPRDGDHGEEPRVRNRDRAVAPTVQQTAVPAARTERKRPAEVRPEQRRTLPAQEP